MQAETKPTFTVSLRLGENRVQCYVGECLLLKLHKDLDLSDFALRVFLQYNKVSG